MNTFSLSEPWWFSERLLRQQIAAVAGHVHGLVLDVGCGRKRYQDLFSCRRYIGVDMYANREVDIVCDTYQLPLHTASVDAVVCNQVLEHLPNPSMAIAEMRRTLREGGILLLSVPFIGRLHGLPHDYWRFSEFGIRQLFAENAFDVVRVQPIGGFWTTQCFLFLFALWEMLAGEGRLRRLARKIAFPPLNLVSAVIYRYDRERLTPFNYVAVGRKVSTESPLPSRSPDVCA